ncbi:MAG: DNRLRE domain-containing protein, partial [candidate division KSB1 bacterium]|nr:DNRLRE domain-containing protein [candidate division KSB1 bacterium]
LDSWVEFDVSAAITGNGVYSFGLKSNSSDRVYYSSKEGTNAPVLVVKTIATPPPTLQLTSPNGSESWIVGSAQNITWTSTGILADVKLEFSTNNGTSWTTIIASTPNDGAHSWTIPDAISSQCLVRISNAATGTPSDVSDGNFAIVSPLPVVASFTPAYGPIGTEVTITGSGFTGATAVTFNGTPAANFTVDSPTRIRAVVPNGASAGAITITNPQGSGASASNFVVTIVLSFTPLSDTYVRLSSPAQSYGANTSLILRKTESEALNAYVKFNVTGLNRTVHRAKLRLHVTDPSDDGGSVYAVANTHRDANTEWTENDLNWNNAPVINEPALSSVGSVSVGNAMEWDVTTAIIGDGRYSFALKNNSSNAVNYSSKEGGTPPQLILHLDAGSVLTPQVSSFSPTSGMTGTEVTIAGVNFNGVTVVAFNGITTPNFTVDSATQIRAVVPFSATTGKISVTAFGSVAQSAANFTVLLPPGTFSFTPSHDAYVRLTSPATNFGAAGTLRLEASAEIFNSYLKFDITNLEGTIQRAKLYLYVTNAGTDGGSVHAISNDYLNSTTPWTESGLTWENAPAMNSPALSSVGAVALDTWVEFDVTAAISGNGIYSFGLKNNSTERVYYSSKEGSRPPVLMITTSGASLIPKVTQFTPNSGPPGTEVTIAGSNFDGITAVSFNGVPASRFTTTSLIELRAEVPAAATTGKITITNANGTGTSANDFIVTPAPTTVTFNPTDDAEVKSSFATTNYGSSTIFRLREGTVKYNSFLKFNVSGLSGIVQRAWLRLYVIEGGDDGGTVYGVSNNYLNTTTPWNENGVVWNNAPAINGAPVSPSAGPVIANTWVDFDVTAALAGNGTYSFGLINGSTTTIKYCSKEGANPPQLVIETITLSPPTISGFSPDSGPAGMEVTISGTGFIGVNAVTFNGTAATNFTVDSPIQVRARVPNGASTGKIGVSNPAGAAQSTADFTVTVSTISQFTFTPQHDAYVRSVSPTNNYGGAGTLRIEGGSEQMNAFLKFEVTGLDGPVQHAKLQLFVTNASNDGGAVYVVSNNYSNSTTPWIEQGLNWNNAPSLGGPALSSTGAVNLNDVVEFNVTSAINGNGIYSFGLKSNSSDRVYYSSKEDTIAPKLIIETASGLPVAPSIFSFTPASGVVGTEVTIVGNGFVGTTQVTFNGTAATNFTVVSQNELRSIVPAGATTGQIGVTTPVGTTQSAVNFIVSSSLFIFTPVHDAYVRSVSPTNNYGAASTLRIEGGSEPMNGFLKFAVAGLDGPVQRAKLRLSVVNASNDGGSVYVVSNNQRSSTTPWAETDLNWNNAPLISGAPLSTAGPVSLDSLIELDVTPAINGEGTYSFGMTSNSSDRVYYSSKEGTIPPQLVIETASGTPIAPSITSFTPSSGPVGTEVTIFGSGFSGTTGVAFNGTAATSFSVISFTQLRATVPNGATSGKISVTNNVGTATSATNFSVTIITRHSFNPVADAEVKSSSPADNFGSFGIVRLRDGTVKYNSYLKFNVSGLVGTVHRAKLRLFVTEGSDDGGRIYAVSNNYLGT